MVFPAEVNVIEVGPRDGFQNVKERIPTEVKIKEIGLMIEAGVRELEVTSFVHPKAIPQMFDAREVAKAIARKYGDRAKLIALVPNIRGAEAAMECGILIVSYVISASEAHNIANVNRTVDESCRGLEELIRQCPQLEVGLDVATAFGCPFAGDVPREKVFALIDRALEAGVRRITLCDTIGIANPKQVAALSTAALERYASPISLHLHDTRGMGLANTMAGMLSGINSFETSVGGLGGCPFAPGAAGNTATEDLLNMLQNMDIHTGIDLDAYMAAVDYVKEKIQNTLTGHMANVCKFYEAKQTFREV